MMNDVEQEAIILDSAWGMIDRMVNWSIFLKNDRINPTNLMFNNSEASLLFVILLGDFLSQIRSFRNAPVPLGLSPAPSCERPSNLTFLFHLRKVCAAPKLGTNAEALSAVVEAFANWLEGDFTAQGVNLSSIDISTDLRITRIRYIKMCGDIAKHNLGRLAGNAHHLRQLLQAAGHKVSEQHSYLAIGDFFEWFQNDIFLYHSSQIAEFLNNIRWSIYDYLQPELKKSWHLSDKATRDFPIYGYHVPTGIKEPLAQAMYWNVMNRSRSEPYVPRFVVPEDFKRRY